MGVVAVQKEVRNVEEAKMAVMVGAAVVMKMVAVMEMVAVMDMVADMEMVLVEMVEVMVAGDWVVGM
jgi:hypothetical protein